MWFRLSCEHKFPIHEVMHTPKPLQINDKRSEVDKKNYFPQVQMSLTHDHLALALMCHLLWVRGRDEAAFSGSGIFMTSGGLVCGCDVSCYHGDSRHMLRTSTGGASDANESRHANVHARTHTYAHTRIFTYTPWGQAGQETVRRNHSQHSPLSLGFSLQDFSLKA